jgi:hypothetical protein
MYTETSVNAGLYSSLCLNLLNHPKRQLDTWTVVGLTAAKFKPLIFPVNTVPWQPVYIHTLAVLSLSGGSNGFQLKFVRQTPRIAVNSKTPRPNLHWNNCMNLEGILEQGTDWNYLLSWIWNLLQVSLILRWMLFFHNWSLDAQVSRHVVRVENLKVK